MSRLLSFIRHAQSLEELIPLISKLWQRKEEFQDSLREILISEIDNDTTSASLAEVTLYPFRVLCPDNISKILKYIYRPNASDDYLRLVCKEWNQWFEKMTQQRWNRRRKMVSNLFRGEPINVGTEHSPDLSAAIRRATVCS